jgi:microcompartment protein CcmK/EutM
MRICKVIGSVVSTQKNQHFKSVKLMFVKPIDLDGSFTAEREMIAIDTVDAGIGDMVIVAQEGSVVKQIMNSKYVPANAIIMGVVDGFEVQE